ncbi:response regulator [Clostridiales bacterium COT073_COT-073]|nr:response regulator [Clostridiales bacterium COT073_COT-073]
MYKLLIVDDEPLIRRGIRSLVNLESIGISEIMEAESGEEAVALVMEHQPQMVLMDINMPDMDGLTAAAIIKERFPRVFVIILTGYDYFEYAQTAIRARVDDYILKPVSRADIEMVLVKSINFLNEHNKQEEIQKVLDSSESRSIDGEAEQADLTMAVTEYLKENIFEMDLSLAKMAKDIGFNSSYLSTMVKQIYGVPFQDYINRKRMEKAKLLLLSTTMKNYEIAEQIGIEDVNYFITKFKKTWGITPKQYRQGLQINED